MFSVTLVYTPPVHRDARVAIVKVSRSREFLRSNCGAVCGSCIEELGE
jgi:hypothetical protein